MDKRTTLAIVLSLLVLFVYSMLAPQPSLPPAGDFQTTENKELKEKSETSRTVVSQGSSEAPSAPESPPEEEEIHHLETAKLRLAFSTAGGALKEAFVKTHDHLIPVTDVFALPAYRNRSFTLEEVGADKVVFALNDTASGLRVVKEYRLGNDYLVTAKIRFQNISDMSKEKTLRSQAFLLDLSKLDKSDEISRRDQGLYEYSIASERGIVRQGNAYKFSSKNERKELAAVRWVGFRDRYFCAIVHPMFSTKNYVVEPLGEKKLKVEVETEGVRLSRNESVEYPASIYLGPQEMTHLGEYGEGFEEIVSFSGFGLFDFFAKLFYRALQALNTVIPNWGVCIVLISIAIYSVMYPLTSRGLRSMKKMQSLQPKMAEIKEKYKDNREKQSKAMMELYKEHKINPFGGCLPFLLQMPIFIGLYQVLWRSVSLKGANFLWIKDLSQPDRLFLLPFDLPLIGNEFNILPILMMVTMFFQQKLSSKSMATADPTQAAQQKMMTTFFPLLLGAIFYKLASGLTLYFITFYLLSTFTQWRISKTMPAT